jgi:RHS repeat-associated protein
MNLGRNSGFGDDWYRYGFNNMEKDDEVKGKGNSYDFGARMYDSRLGRWLSRDAHFSKYPGFSPYNFVTNTPLNAIDPDGNDVIILAHGFKSGHQYGHQALMVGNDKDGWTYYSKDNDATGKNNDGYTIKEFKTFEDFVKSVHNTHVYDYDAISNVYDLSNSEYNSSGEIEVRYKNAYRIKTSDLEDKKMMDAARKSVKSEYSASANCTHVVTDALDAIERIENGETFNFKIKIFENDEGSLYWEFGIKNYRPLSKQEAIIFNNPEGKDISDKLTPQKK